MQTKVGSYVQGLEMILFLTPIVAGVFGISGKIDSNLLAKISLATHGPLLALMSLHIAQIYQNKNLKGIQSSSILKTSILVAYYTTAITLAIFALKGKVTAHQLGWGIVGPMIAIASLPLFSTMYSRCCKPSSNQHI